MLCYDISDAKFFYVYYHRIYFQLYHLYYKYNVFHLFPLKTEHMNLNSKKHIITTYTFNNIYFVTNKCEIR